MGILKRILGKSNPMDVFHMPIDPDEFLIALSRRPMWAKIDVEHLKNISRNADKQAEIYISEPSGSSEFSVQQVKIELMRNLVFVSEKSSSVKMLVKQVNHPADIFGTPLTQYAITLYTLGSEYCKQLLICSDQDKASRFFMMADLSFTSSVLCDYLQLSSYFGMIYLHGIMKNKLVGLDWCKRYFDAEKELLKTPDDELSYYHKANKESVINPGTFNNNLVEMSKIRPKLFSQTLSHSESEGKVVRDLHAMLLLMPD